VLTVILAGQFINVATGSVGVLLMMTGHERQLKQLTLASSFILIVLCFLLIPHLGGVGAALAVTVSTTVLNLSALYVAQLRLGIRVCPFPAFKKPHR
jgi:O-antigen/teichoic acid export membrane protein